MQQKNLSHTIVVLAGGISLDGKLPDYVYARLDRAIELFRSSEKNNIVLSGRYSFLFPKDKLPPTTEANRMERYLLEKGIPKNKISKESYSRDTISNAYFLKKLIFLPRRIHAATVITSTFHLLRVKYIFQKVFGSRYSFDFIGVPEDLPEEKAKQVMTHQKEVFVKTRAFLDPISDGQHEYLRGKFFQAAYYREPRPAGVIDFVAQGK